MRVGLLLAACLVISGCSAATTVTVTKTVTKTVGPSGTGSASSSASQGTTTSSASSSAATLQFTVDEAGDRLVVASRAAGTDWRDVAVQGTCATGGTVNLGGKQPPHYDVNATAGNSTLFANACTAQDVAQPVIAVATAAAAVELGDFLSFCSSGQVINMRVKVTVGGAQADEKGIISIAPCK